MKNTPATPARGTRDLLGEEMQKHQAVLQTARRVMEIYRFSQWDTPIFEQTRVFQRLGETSDVVSKEMYTFEDRGGEQMTLRPENTAAICRALISNGLTQTLPQRVFYTGPMFRFERPQRGRFRQFHQIGAELLGVNEPMADADVIACGWNFLSELGIDDRVTLQINTLGDKQSRQQYRDALVAALTPNRDRLSPESRERLQRNPLRILDSKNPSDQELLKDVPIINQYLTPDAQRFYDQLQETLTLLGIPFQNNPRIVRGLDYYNHTAFEITTDQLGAQGTVLAGGRYDGLVAEMGGPNIGGVGWAAGIERLCMLIEQPPPPPAPVCVIPVGQEQQTQAVQVLQTLRLQGIRAEMAYRGNIKRHLENANRIGARYCVIIGSQEVEQGTLTLKDLTNGEQSQITLDELIQRQKA